MDGGKEACSGGLPGANDNKMREKYLMFWLGDERYAIPLQYILGTIDLQRISRIPKVERYIKGVINLRGEVILVADVRLRFGMIEEYSSRTKIILTRIGEVSVGLIVDAVDEVCDISSDKIGASPKIATAQSADFIQGIARIGDKVVIVLDVGKLLNANDLAVAVSSLS